MSLPPHLSLKKALRSSEVARGSAGQTRRGAGAQLCHCPPWQLALGWALSRLLPQVRAVRVHWWLCQLVPMQCLDRCGLHPFVCVLIALPVLYCWSRPLVQVPVFLLHNSPALSFTAALLHAACPLPCCLQRAVLQHCLYEHHAHPGNKLTARAPINTATCVEHLLQPHCVHGRV